MSDETAATTTETPPAAPPMRAETGDGTPPLDRDAGRIDAAEWPLRTTPPIVGERASGFQVIVKRSVLNEVHRHGKETSDVEICGVLVGNVYRDARGPYLYIESSIRGNHATSKVAQVTFTAETWSAIQEVMDRAHPDQKILGWYHTHPGFGVFLSGMDVFIHENFFSFPWQVAVVYDPKGGTEGLFVWRRGRTQKEAFLVEEDVPNEEPNVVLNVSASSGPDGAATGGAFGATAPQELVDRVDVLERRQRWLLLLVALLGMVSVAWPLVVVLLMPYRQFAPPPGQAPANTRPSATPDPVRPGGLPFSQSRPLDAQDRPPGGK